jgi:transcriptional regulator with XRE-family HTH domain
MDLVLKLRELRRLRGLSQKDVARLSGVGEKTISSFETGQRIGSLKLAQLRNMLGVYGLTEAEFFGSTVEKEIAPWEMNPEEFAITRLMDDIRALPQPVRQGIVAKFQLMVEGAAVQGPEMKERRPSFMRDNPDWHSITSRN